MKLRYILVLSLFISQLAYSQQLPNPLASLFQPELYNPALMGSFDGSKITANYRQQWLGLSDALTPTTINLVYSHQKLNKIGLGGYLLNDQFGTIRRLNVGLSGAYYIFDDGNTSLSAGFSVGMWQHGLDFSSMTLDNPTDPLLSNNTLINNTNLDLNFGINLSTKLGETTKLNINSGLLQLANQTFNYGDGLNYTSNIHVIIAADVAIQASEQLEIVPSLQFRSFIDPANSGLTTEYPDVDAALKVGYQLNEDTKLGVGAGYRVNAGPFALLRLDLNNFGVQFIGENHPTLGNSIELGLTYTFGNSNNPNPNIANNQSSKTDECAASTSKGTDLIAQSQLTKSEANEALNQASNLLNQIKRPIACNKTANKAVLEKVNEALVLFENKKTALKTATSDYEQLLSDIKQNNCKKTIKELEGLQIATLDKDRSNIDSKINEINKELNQKKVWEDPRVSQVKQGISIYNGETIVNNDNQIRIAYEDRDDGEYVITSMNSSSEQYWSYIKNTITLMKEIQADPCSRTISNITIEVAVPETDLNESADIQFSNEYSLRNYTYEGVIKQLNLKDGDDINFEQLNALKGISIKHEIQKALKLQESAIEVKINSGKALPNRQIRNISITINHQ